MKNDDATSRCRPPRLTVVGHPSAHRAVSVRPGQTLRLHGRDYTDDCVSGSTGTPRTVGRLQLVLQSAHHIGPLATVHPSGAGAAFTVSVTIPPGTAPGAATIFDVLAPPHGTVRLVVRR
jgi:hypothetical protein